MTALLNALRGTDLPPGIVGALRGTLEAIVLMAIAMTAATVLSLDWGAYEIVVGPVVLWAFRTLEGIADNIDPAKRATGTLPPAPAGTTATGSTTVGPPTTGV